MPYFPQSRCYIKKPPRCCPFQSACAPVPNHDYANDLTLIRSFHSNPRHNIVWGDARELRVFGCPPSHTFKKAFPQACGPGKHSCCWLLQRRVCWRLSRELGQPVRERQPRTLENYVRLIHSSLEGHTGRPWGRRGGEEFINKPLWYK